MSQCSHSTPSAEAPLSADNDSFVLTIPALDCPSEERAIRQLLGRFPIERLEFNLSQHQLKVKAPTNLRAPITSVLAEHGFKTAETDAKGPTTSYIKLGLAAVFALSAELIHFCADTPWIAAALALVAIALGGLRTYQLGWQALKQGKLNVNSLMSVAVTGAFLIGQWAEAAMVMVLFTLADHIEARTVDKARHSIAKLLTLAPQQALVWHQGKWQQMLVSHIQAGMKIRVAPGERIGLDGVILHGHSTVDEAAFTGENLPVEKKAQDLVLAGTVNITGSIEVEVKQTSDQTALAKMIQLIEQAQQQQVPIERWIDQFAKVYTPAVFAIAIAAALLLPILTQHTWFSAVYAALVLLVIACPCALVLAAPVTISAGLTHGARAGILIKGGAYLELGKNIDTVVFDKTGTLTQGKPKVQSTQAGLDAHVALGAELASHSQHPVSQTIAATYPRALEQEGFSKVSDHVGGGISGWLNGERYLLGNLPWLLTQVNLSDEDAHYWLEQTTHWEKLGCSVSLFANDSKILVLYALQDTLRPLAKESLSVLQKQQQMQLLLLTGDNAHSAQMIAQSVGISEVYHRQSPELKAKHIESLQQQGKHIAMVGDGINDGLALAKADIGISLGQAGTDVAREAADVMLMDNSLAKLPYFFNLSKRTHRLVVQNISIAVGVKAIILFLALLGISHMWMAVLADVGVSLVVVANGLRALKLSAAQQKQLASLH